VRGAGALTELGSLRLRGRLLSGLLLGSLPGLPLDLLPLVSLAAVVAPRRLVVRRRGRCTATRNATTGLRAAGLGRGAGCRLTGAPHSAARGDRSGDAEGAEHTDRHDAATQSPDHAQVAVSVIGRGLTRCHEQASSPVDVSSTFEAAWLT
jgi:hypothetical protein